MLTDSESSEERWTLRRIVNRSAKVFHDEGLRSVFFRILGETVYRRMVLLERPLDLPIVPATAGVPLEVRMAVRTVGQEYLDFRRDTQAATVRRRLEAGHWYATAHHEGRLVYVRWVGVEDAYEYYIGCNFNMPPEDVYAYDLFVAPDLRGQNVATAVASQLYQYLHDEGYQRVITTIIPETKVSLHVAKKTGNRVIGKVGYYKLGPWKKTFCRTVPGSVPLELSFAHPGAEE